MSEAKPLDYYCSQKFWWLNVDLGKFQTFSCCAATPQRINVNWLKNHPGNLFNTPELIDERRSMLDNRLVDSCNATCWIPESQGKPSRRLSMGTQNKTHLEIAATPEIINIVVGSDCNMTCVYCCKFYSSAWTRDIANGTYPVDVAPDRFTINTLDKAVAAISQKQITATDSHQTILDEIISLSQSPKLQEIIITGGEPFLYLNLARLVKSIPAHVPVTVYSGLGVDEHRFARELQNLTNNVTVTISAENIGPAYEFVRYGNTWQRFLNNLNQLKKQGIAYKFNATVTNLTAPGLMEFVDWAQTAPINFQLCNDPDFLSIGVLDNVTKDLLRSKYTSLPDFIAQALEITPTDQQVRNFKAYVKEFSHRRSLSTLVFPKTLVDWLEQ
jgi:molybdenum cofactor biosynthesis enzyme MoaA